MLSQFRAMPGGIRIFLGYALLVLGLIGLSLRWVVDQAISAPISLPGVVVMVLLAYTIFTTTLVLQRKEASRTLALGLSTLTLPAIPLALLAAQPVAAVIIAILAALLFFGLTRPEVRAWLNEPEARSRRACLLACPCPERLPFAEHRGPSRCGGIGYRPIPSVACPEHSP